jgi:hypothetical protein
LLENKACFSWFHEFQEFSGDMEIAKKNKCSSSFDPYTNYLSETALFNRKSKLWGFHYIENICYSSTFAILATEILRTKREVRINIRKEEVKGRERMERDGEARKE